MTGELEIALSIVIVNWNSRSFLRNCLRSIYATGGDLAFEVIVVDNASYDGSKEMAEEEFPSVRFIQSHVNLGFAGANNLACKQSRGRNLLFLNPDTEVLDDALMKLQATLISTSNAGIVGARLLNEDHSLQTSCIQAFPSIWNQMLDTELLRRRYPKAALWGTRPLFEQLFEPVPVDAVSGACLMIRRKVFESVNGFSAEYFMYSEDLDLCFKVDRAGWKRYYCSEAVVVHFGGRSSGASSESNFAAVLTKESQRRFFEARRGKWQAVFYQLTMGIIALLRLAALACLLLGTLEASRRAGLRAVFYKWFKVLRWSIGWENWVNRPA